MTPEFSRPVRVDTIGTSPRDLSLDADAHERAALAERFGLAGLDSLHAELALSRRGEIVFAKGLLTASLEQSCVVTAEPVPVAVEEKFEIVFRPAPADAASDEIEISQSETDVVFYDGVSIDLGEAVAETLSLALDPYPRAPGAEHVLKEAGIKSDEDAEAERDKERAANSPFAVLRKD